MSAYTEALQAAEKDGIFRCTDAELMAHFCDSGLRLLCGGVWPELVWGGAQKQGLTTEQLTELAYKDPRAVADLMFV